jgi:hypothetical protein
MPKAKRAGNESLWRTAPAVVDSLEPRVLMAATVTGTVYNDLNANGKQDVGEPGLSGWVVYHDVNKNGVRDPADAVATSDAAGKYVLTGIVFTRTPPSLTEYIREDTPPGWQLTQPGATAAPGTTNNGAYWIRPIVTLRGQMVFLNRNFGNHAVATQAAAAPASTNNTFSSEAITADGSAVKLFLKKLFMKPNGHYRRFRF